MHIGIGWVVLCFVIAWAAGQKGRSGVGFFFLSLFLSPLVGGFVLLVVSSRKADPPPALLQAQQASSQTAAVMPPSQSNRGRTFRNFAAVAVLLCVSYCILKPAESPSSISTNPVIQTASAPTPNPPRAVPATPSSMPNRPLTTGIETLEAQRLLYELGFDPGPRDGVSGPATVAAVKRYEGARKWTITGDLDVRLLEYLRADKGAPNFTSGQPTAAPSTSAVTMARPSTEAMSEEMRLATRAIREADHPCPTILAAQRVSDGSVRASYSNGEVYRVMMLRGDWLAMRCSAAERLGVSGC